MLVGKDVEYLKNRIVLKFKHDMFLKYLSLLAPFRIFK